MRRAQESPEPGNTTEREEEIRELQQQVQDKDEENRQMRQEHAQQIQGLQQIMGSQNNHLQEKDDIIRKKNDIIWNKVANLPVTQSTCVTLHGRLLAIGGCDSKYTPTSDVHIYHPTSNTWEVISKMKISRRWCFAAVLPTNQLMVVGGYTTSNVFSETDSVEIATVV